MNLYNFILDRDKLLLPIKAQNFIWFLRVFACVSCCGPKSVLFKKDSGMASCLPFLERTCRLDCLSGLHPWKPLSARTQGLEGTGARGPEPGSASAQGLLVPCTPGSCVLRLHVNQSSSCRHQTPQIIAWVAGTLRRARGGSRGAQLLAGAPVCLSASPGGGGSP